MIKLLPLLLAFSLAFGENTDYLLPDNNSLFSHALKGALKHSRSGILIITPSFNHTLFKRAAIEGIKRGSSLILVVQKLKGDPLSLAQYARTDIRTLEGRSLEGSIILVDDKFACTIPESIDQEKLGDSAALIRCSNDEREITSLRKALAPLLARSKSYLK